MNFLIISPKSCNIVVQTLILLKQWRHLLYLDGIWIALLCGSKLPMNFEN